MPARLTGTAYLPSPPINRLRNPGAGKPAGRTGVTSTGAGGVKSNVGAPPATNGTTRQGVKKVSTTVG